MSAGLFTALGCSSGSNHAPKDMAVDGGGVDGGATQQMDGGAATLSVFDAWRALREAIRKSPDHLVAQADLAASSRDPQRILDFVSQNIQTIPATATGFSSGANSMRWGPRAALRGGAGTMREKAELLANLFTQAGLTARVMAVSVDDPASLGPRMLAPLARPSFAPLIDDASLARWQVALGIDPSATPTPVKTLDYSQADALAGSIMPLLQSDAANQMSPQTFDWTGLYSMPVVQVSVNGSQTWANPAIAGTKLGDSLSSAKPVVADAPAAVGTIHVKLEGVTAARPTHRELLVEGSYTISDLVGRQLVASFVPAVSPEQMLTATVGSVDGFYPILGVRGVDLTAEQTAVLAQSGAVINTSGDVVAQTSRGTMTINGQPLGDVISQADATARVSSIEVASVNASAFPRVQIRARALDAAGQMVSGVPAAAITVAEAGSARPLVVLQNAAPAPRVLFVLDTSTSMPAEFLGAQAASVVHSMATQLLSLDARSEFAVAAVMLGLAGTSAWLTDPAALEAAAAQESGTASALWGALDAASGTGASLVVLISDGQADSQPTDAQLARIAAGPPAVLLKVGTSADNSFQQMADLTGGARFEVADASAAVTAVSNILQRLEQAPLILEYQAPTEGASSGDASVSPASSYDASTVGGVAHSLVLTVGKAPTASATYSAPPSATGAAPPAWAGLYLTFDDGTQQVTRVLGGQIYPSSDAPVPQAAIDDARYALYGQYVVSFEAGAPTAAEWLDDILTSKIALEGLWNAVTGGKDSDILAALKEGLPYIPGELPTLHAPLPAGTDSTLTFETGPRVVLVSAYPHPTRGVVRHADILPFTQFATVGGATPADNFARTLARSSILAMAEEQLYKESTSGLLRGQTLEVLAPYAVATPFPALGSTGQAAWQTELAPFWDKIAIVPADGSKPAFFVVDPKTGSLLAMLSDGSGGGLSASDQALGDGTLKLLDLMNVVGAFGGASLGFGCTLALGAAILKVVLAEAAMVAQIGPDATADNPFSKAACGLGCDLAKNLIAVPVPWFGKIDGILVLLNHGITCGCPP